MGAKTPSTSDRRVKRTRRTLREALVALLLERGWDDVSVQDVCERADVGRSTFYVHFADKEDLLTGGFDDLRAALRRELAPAAPDHPLPFLHGLLLHAYDQQRLFRTLVGKRGGEAVLKRFRALVLDLVREDLRTLGAAAETREATAQFVAGGLVQLLGWWLDARAPLPPAQAEELFLSLAAPALRPPRR